MQKPASVNLVNNTVSVALLKPRPLLEHTLATVGTGCCWNTLLQQ